MAEQTDIATNRWISAFLYTNRKKAKNDVDVKSLYKLKKLYKLNTLQVATTTPAEVECVAPSASVVEDPLQITFGQMLWSESVAFVLLLITLPSGVQLWQSVRTSLHSNLLVNVWTSFAGRRRLTASSAAIFSMAILGCGFVSSFSCFKSISPANSIQRIYFRALLLAVRFNY